MFACFDLAGMQRASCERTVLHGLVFAQSSWNMHKHSSIQLQLMKSKAMCCTLARAFIRHEIERPTCCSLVGSPDSGRWETQQRLRQTLFGLDSTNLYFASTRRVK